MAAKPSQLPRWATSAGRILEPPETGTTTTSKDAGHIENTRPPPRMMNWWQNLVYKWCQYLDDIEAQQLNWTKRHTFSVIAGLTAVDIQNNDPTLPALTVENNDNGPAAAFSGGPGSTSVLVSGAAGGVGLSSTAGTGANTIALEALAGNDASSIAVRGRAVVGTGVVGESLGAAIGGFFTASSSGEALYIQATGSVRGIFATHGTTGNAHTGWLEGYAGAPTAIFAPLYLEQKYAAPSGWVNRCPAMVVGQGQILFTGTQPTSGQDPGFKNVANATNQIKAWVLVSFDGAGNRTILDRYNVASLNFGAGGFTTILDLTLQQAMSDQNWGIKTTAYKPGIMVNPNNPTSTTACNLSGWDCINDVQVDFASYSGQVFIEVSGRQ
jgi:hypothetical protein